MSRTAITLAAKNRLSEASGYSNIAVSPKTPSTSTATKRLLGEVEGWRAGLGAA
jgi:hypothetical protein